MADDDNGASEFESLRQFLKEFLSAADKSGLATSTNQQQSGTSTGMLLQRLILAYKLNQPSLDNFQTFHKQFAKYVDELKLTPDLVQEFKVQLTKELNKSLMAKKELTFSEVHSITDQVGLILDEITGTLKPDPNHSATTQPIRRPSPFSY